MTELEAVVRRLKREKIKGQVWVDGSFLTEKIDPVDSDIVLSIASTVYDNGSASQRATLQWLNSNLKRAFGTLCDSFVHVRYKKGHPLYQSGVFMRAYWMRQWGFNRSDQMKGIAVIKL